ncbi:hypothetical protein F3Y22_tig00110045pilonHSYRG00085 [Hibiscus syriacus]|uniref:Uncharacterized protein n=1 Tax=Hibiscus syriacus TaxID=106335 RepID=A0A6A3BM87_HIBSY|nr:hypothetical protein F3Y22_tig00110045pilonHSYRG00085 [Hibiscus syriacus]
MSIQFNKLLSSLAIETVFEQTDLENETAPPPTSSTFGAMANFLVPKLSAGFAGSSSHERSSNAANQSKILKKERYVIRPPIKYNWSLPGHKTDIKPPQIFQHELL